MEAGVTSGGVAVIGIACRLPGAVDWRQYWGNLCEGVESITFFTDQELLAAGVDPAVVADPCYVKAGFVLPEPDGFDAGFFRCSPHEARLIDPQQRLLLEAAWEAFEDAGYPPGQKYGPVGVFAATGGVVSSYLMNELSDHPDAHGRTASLLHLGNDKDFSGTRISFKFDLTGPSLNIQTACSTSMVLIDQACKAIRSGECTMALAAAGTVRVPQIAGYLAEKGALSSPDGHVRAFDADAAGTAFSSGIGAVLLKSVEQAQADGDHIYAVIRGMAVNNDGARKASYAGTSVRGQTEVMVRAMNHAGIAPGDLGYVECHGTGTHVGDPREFTALLRAFGDTPPTEKCPIGSVKPNIGHSEQSAGLSAFIKAVLALKTGVIPPTINFHKPNPRIKFESSPFFVNTTLRDWTERAGRPRRALVNALGIGGTNVAAVLEQAPDQIERPASSRTAHIFALSAKSPTALEQTASRHRAVLAASPALPLADFCHTVAAGRSQFEHRLAVIVSSTDELAAALETVKTRESTPRPKAGRKIGFLFSGQGAQSAGMGKALYETEPAFRAALDRVFAAMAPHLDRPLADILFAADGAIDQTIYTQPALFAVEYAMADMLAGWGIHPEAVAGHSVGEFAAACLAGIFPLEDAARLICARGRLMQALPPGGAMAAVLADEATIAALIAPWGPRIAIAAVNGPTATVVSGEDGALSEILAECERQGIVSRRLTVSHAFHSPLMDPALAELRQACASVTAQAPGLAWFSTLTGRRHDDPPSPDYWCRQAREAVRFADAVREMAAQGITDFIEIGPGKSLLNLGRTSHTDESAAWHPTLGQGAVLFETVAALYRRGLDVDWNGFHAGHFCRRLSLPTYAFQRERMWVDEDRARLAPVVKSRQMPGTLAGSRISSPLPAAQFENLFSRTRFDWLDDHRVHGAIVLPTTAGFVAALEAAREKLGDGPWDITDFSHDKALLLGDDEERTTHLVIEATGSTPAGFTLSSLDPAAVDIGGGAWSLHMRGTLRRPSDAAQSPGRRFDADAVRRRCPVPVVAERYYAGLRSLGLGYGDSFRGIQSLWRGTGEALGRVHLSERLAAAGKGLAHPALLDACLHVYPAVIDAHGDFTTSPPDKAVAYLPLGMERFSYTPSEAREFLVHARRRDTGPADGAMVDIDAFDPEGRRVLCFTGLSVKPLSPDLFRPAVPGATKDGWLYRVRWDDRPLAAAPAQRPDISPVWLVLGGDAGGLDTALAAALAVHGARTMLVPTSHMPDSVEGYIALLDKLAAEAGGGVAMVVHLVGTASAQGDCTDDARQVQVLGSAFHMARAMAEVRTNFRAAPRLWLVSRNATAMGASDPACDVLAAGLWGLGRSLALEAPAIWGGLVDLQADMSAAQEMPLLAAHLVADDGENQVAWRDGRRLAARLVRDDLPPRRATQPAPGTYLVTGGLGALGIETALWIARNRPSPTIVLASRQGNSAANASTVRHQLEALGAKVSVAKADISHPGDVRKLVQRLKTMDPPLKGIYHSAGVLDDGLLERMDWDKIRRALAPKLDAAWYLHLQTRDMALDDFVLYSSVLSLIGSAGQTNYTAANACLDALAAHRRALGLAGLAVNWGPWAEVGLASALGEQGEAVWRARGMHYLPPDLGQTACDALFDSHMGQAMVAVTDWPVFLRQFPQRPAFYAELQGDTMGGLGDDIAQLRARFADPNPAIRRAVVADFLVRQVSGTLGLAKPAPMDRPLRELGLDSLMAVTLINRVESAIGVKIPAITLVRGPSIDDLIEEVWPDLARSDSVGEAPQTTTAPSLPHAPKKAGGWLVRITPRTNPRFRVFCFPFAGGGSAAFQNWAAQADPNVELIAIEPPGRLSRIAEPPVREMNVFVDRVLEAMEGLMDVPFALFGHCLGGLTLYETARRMVAEGRGRPRHLFCSGSRAPDRAEQIGRFEKKLVRHMISQPGYQAKQPPYRQSDAVFAEIIRQFDMAATDQFLDNPELRRLMLPAVRAEFEMTSKYRFQPARPWDIPITCFVSRGDLYVSREDVLGWGRFTNSRLQVHMREGTHYSIFEDAAFIQRIISRELMATGS
jgi:acyl transferase domain-containing protein/surfactin synthase thioesterase subunit/acyl carrier protein